MRFRVEPRSHKTNDALVFDIYKGRVFARFTEWEDADQYVALMNMAHAVEVENGPGVEIEVRPA